VHVALDVRQDPSLSKPSIRHLTMRSPHLLEVLLSAIVADTAFIFASPVDLLYPPMDRRVWRKAPNQTCQEGLSAWFLSAFHHARKPLQ
jgi:hypothetical protein